MLEGSPGAEHHPRDRELCFPPLQAVRALPGEPGPGRTDAPAGSWVGAWRALFFDLSPSVISEISQREGVREDRAKNSCRETAAG